MSGIIFTPGGSVGGIVNPGLAGGRLTLTSGVAAPHLDQYAKSMLYYTPGEGDLVSLKSGGDWETHRFAELFVAIPATIDTNHDIFLYDNAGVLTLDPVAWANDTTRATALAVDSGVEVKFGASTHKYLGTLRTTDVNGECEDSIYRRFIWNRYNRIPRVGRSHNTGVSWVYAVAVHREFNAGVGQKRFELVCGLPTLCTTKHKMYISAIDADGHTFSVYVGYDSTSSDTVPPSGVVFRRSGGFPALINGPDNFAVIAANGYHFFTELEYTTYSGTNYPNTGNTSALVVEMSI